MQLDGGIEKKEKSCEGCRAGDEKARSVSGGHCE